VLRLVGGAYPRRESSASHLSSVPSKIPSHARARDFEGDSIHGGEIRTAFPARVPRLPQGVATKWLCSDLRWWILETEGFARPDDCATVVATTNRSSGYDTRNRRTGRKPYTHVIETDRPMPTIRLAKKALLYASPGP